MLDDKPFLARAEEVSGEPVAVHAEARLVAAGSVVGEPGLLCAVPGALIFVEDELLAPGEVTRIAVDEVTSADLEPDFGRVKLKVHTAAASWCFEHLQEKDARLIAAAAPVPLAANREAGDETAPVLALSPVPPPLLPPPAGGGPALELPPAPATALALPGAPVGPLCPPGALDDTPDIAVGVIAEVDGAAEPAAELRLTGESPPAPAPAPRAAAVGQRRAPALSGGPRYDTAAALEAEAAASRLVRDARRRNLKVVAAVVATLVFVGYHFNEPKSKPTPVPVYLESDLPELPALPTPPEPLPLPEVAPEPPPLPAAPDSAALAPHRGIILGSLRVNSTPAAVVLLDGRRIGVTPLVVNAAPGTHRLLLRTLDGRTKTTTVRVLSAATTSYAVQF